MFGKQKMPHVRGILGRIESEARSDEHLAKRIRHKV